MSAPESAVRFQNGCKSYGRKDAATPVLNNLNMTVPRGSIYGLLGASGCGKTTILSCIAGRLQLDSGELQVLGGEPGTKGSGIPGPRVGYMPQDISLVGEFSVKNMLYYFGWMFGMSSPEIAERHSFLSRLLELPTDDRLITELSGGQQRRVSLAAALVQTPELLLLDEPTVGLDPVLRQSIWDYLVQISRDQDITIIITTHYIEEATQAHKIGLLRNGMLLADAAPRTVIARYGCTTLEEAYLLLSSHQEHNTARSGGPKQERQRVAEEGDSCVIDRKANEASSIVRQVAFDEVHHTYSSTASSRRRPVTSFSCRMKALLYKDFLTLLRNNSGLFFLFLFPVVEVCIFFTTIGNDSTGMPLGVVNDEYLNCSQIIAGVRETSGVSFYDEGGDNSCHYHGLSCLFIDLLQKKEVLNIIHYGDQQAALAAARRTEGHSVLYFPANYSRMLEQRYQDGTTNASDAYLEQSEIAAWVDMSNYINGHQVRLLFYKTFGELTDILSDGCNISKKLSRTPVKFNEPLFETSKPSFRDFMVPGVMLLITYFLSAVVTGTNITTERVNGLWGRTLVAGTSVAEILLSHILANVAGLLIQCVIILVMTFFIYDLECRGSVTLVCVILGLQSFAGICFGILVGAISPNTTAALYCIVGSFVPYTLITGVMWPIESIIAPVRYFSYTTPGTLAAVSLSNVMLRGRDLYNPQVYPGVVVTLAWIVVPYVVAVWVLRRK